jgi:flagellar hook-basal body complex protein FliE
MNIEAIAPMAQSMAVPIAPSATSLVQGGGGFGDWIAREVASTNQSLLKAEGGIRKVALGDSSDLHGVMIDLEQAKLSFQLLTQVRARALEAYQDILRMQV